MAVRIEFFGVVRQRAGREVLEVEASTLRQALRRAVELSPPLADCCSAEGSLLPGYMANVNGVRFVQAGDTPLTDGDAVLLLSTDAGG